MPATHPRAGGCTRASTVAPGCAVPRASVRPSTTTRHEVESGPETVARTVPRGSQCRGSVATATTARFTPSVPPGATKVIGASSAASGAIPAHVVACASVSTTMRPVGIALSFTSVAARRSTTPASPAPSSARIPESAALIVPASPPITAPSMVSNQSRSPVAEASTMPRAAALSRPIMGPSAPAAADESELSITIATAVGACPMPGSQPNGRAAASAMATMIAIRSTINSRFLSRTSRACSRSMRMR